MRRFIGIGTLPNDTTRILAEKLGISIELSCALYNRGARDADSMRAFLAPGLEQLHDPFGLPDMRRAVDRIRSAIERGERICVYGDYDVDGICATAILLLYLQSVGADVIHYIPSRHGEGYGMNSRAVAELKQRGVELIVTVDNGISAIGEIALCKELGIDVVVTDHHQCMDKLPDCIAVVNAARPDSAYENPFLCGAGVAMKLVEAMAGRAAAERYLPFAGLATVADVTPLRGENRALTALTLRALNEGKCPVGMQTLAKEANEKQTAYSVRDLSFGLAPRLNAAGRLGDAEKALSLFCESDSAKAADMAQELSAMNRLRQEEEKKILAEAEALLEKINIPKCRMIMLYAPGWNSGIVGIVASRLTERYYRPTFLFCGDGDEITGSGRSIPQVNLFDALKAHEKYFIRFGGHAGAAGATMNKNDFAALEKDMDAWLHEHVPDELFIPSVEYEFETDMENLSLQLAENLEKLAPFGEGNPIPAFYVHGMKIANLKFMGQEGQHVRFDATKNGRCAETVAFQWGDRLKKLPLEPEYDMVCRLSVNEWRGYSRLQLMLTALEQDPAYMGRFQPWKAEEKFFDAILQNVLYNNYTVSAEIKRTSTVSASSLLERDIAGALVLCFTPVGARCALDELAAGGSKADISMFEPGGLSPGYNAAVMAPLLDRIPFERYDRIFAYDVAAVPEMLETIRSQSAGAEVIVNENFAYDWNPFRECDVSRNGMKPYYRVLLANKEKRYPSREYIVSLLMSETGGVYQQCALATQVFMELAFIRQGEDRRWMLDQYAEQRRLEDSRTFAFASKMSKRAEN